MSQVRTKSATSFQEIKEIVQGKISSGKKVRTALVAPSDVKALQAIVRATKEKLIEPLLIGDEKLVRSKAEKNNLDISSFECIDLNQPKMAVEAASKLAEKSEIELIVKGRYHTVDLIDDLFHSGSDFLTKQFPVHVGVFKVAAYSKLLFVSDGFVNAEPNLKVKIGIIEQTAKVARLAGIAKPKAAVLAAVEVVYPQMQSTLDGAVLSKMSERKQIKNCMVEGPLSFDIAVDRYAAEAKGITNSEVAGDADLLIAPNIETANGIYKAMALYAKADIGGLIIGGKVPITLNLDSDSTDNYYNSLLLGLLTI